MENQTAEKTDLSQLCSAIREMLPLRKYEQCEQLIKDALQQHPEAPQPHNLYGLLFEAKGDRSSAMSHFRKARELDATYKPAQHNLNHFGTFYSYGKCAFDESDCPDAKDTGVIELDANGIGRVVRSVPCDIRYDANGVGHVYRRNV